MEKYDVLINKLEELNVWLDKASAYGFRDEIGNIINELKKGAVSDARRRMLKRILSNNMGFNGKKINDLTVEGFSDEGKIIPWIDYIISINELAEEIL